MEVSINRARLSVIQGDITQQSTDTIVNAANPGLIGGGGVDGAIHRAGGSAILEECKQIVSRQGRLPTGRAVITTGGNLKARFVIHTVGPVWYGGNKGEPELLSSAYGYPTAETTKEAIRAVVSFLEEQVTLIKEVVFVLFDAATFESYSSALDKVTKESREAGRRINTNAETNSYYYRSDNGARRT